jgi:acyl carrier protein
LLWLGFGQFGGKGTRRGPKPPIEIREIEAAQVTKDATFAEDLDADSLDVVELVMELEEEFGIEVPEEELQDVKTVGQAFDIIVSKL